MRMDFNRWKWLITIVLLGFALLFLSCCRTTRLVETETITKDTTSYAHWDSIVNARVRIIKDSLLAFHWEQAEKSTKDSVYIKNDVRTKVDENGKVLGRDSIHIEIRYRDNKESSMVRDSLLRYKSLVDSIDVYRAQRDSVRHLVEQRQSKKVYVEKELKGWNLFYWKFGMVTFWSVCLALIGLILIYLRHKGLFYTRF